MELSEEEESRAFDVMLFVIGTCDDLKRDGYLTGGPSLSEKGYADYQSLKESGFEPTEEEVKHKMAFLMSDKAVEIMREAIKS